MTDPCDCGACKELPPLEAGEGWQLVSMHDPALRRGIWFRRDGDAVEICAGREGNDFRCRIAPGTIDAKTIAFLVECLDTGRWMVSEDAPRLLADLEEEKHGRDRRHTLREALASHAEDP